MKVNIVWFRRDLRLLDNEIVAKACDNGQPTMFVFCIDPWFFNQKEIGWKRVHFLFESLVDLDQSLRKLGSSLIILEGNTVESLQSLGTYLKSQNIEPNLFYNLDIQTEYGLERDRNIRKFWQNNGWSIYEGKPSFLVRIEEKSDFTNWGKEYYNYQNTNTWDKPNQINTFDTSTLSKALKTTKPSKLLERFNTTSQPKSELFNGGESEAHKVLESFLEVRSVGYHWKLSRPWLSQIGAVSQLSPHITFGTISTRVVHQQSSKKRKLTDSKHAFSLKAFEERLRWREHFLGKLLKDPSIKWKNHYPEYDSVYNQSELTEDKLKYLEKWKAGHTGFALIDASMRQLKSQGVINFRMRAMNATFLTINCGVSWHFGAEYFMTQLVDGDIAINHWQWQMQAGITNPFSDTFRIYNPSINIKEKDPELQYIHFWCPEYRQFHTPAEVVAASEPMLDFSTTRKENGKVISDLRQKVRTRLAVEYGIKLPTKKAKKPTVKSSKLKKTSKKLTYNLSEDLFGEGNS